MSFTNEAAFLDSKGSKLRIGAADTPTPEANEVLIKNYAVAINPVDWMIQDTGFFVEGWPAVLGCDLAGEVVAVGSDVKTIQKGQRVLAHPHGLLTKKPGNSSFQKYTAVLESVTTPIPDSLSYEEAAVIPLGLSTAIQGLYLDTGLPYPKANPESSGKKILVWGGSSSVGSAAIQLAVAAGFDVVATASPKNFDYVKKLGAKEVFDHSSKTIVDDLKAALPKEKYAGAFDAITAKGSTEAIAAVVDSIGGGLINIVLEPPKDLPASIKTNYVFAPMAAGSPAGNAIYKDWLPKALASGQFKAVPAPKVVGEGLESLQTGVDTLRNGVSATKLVVKL